MRKIFKTQLLQMRNKVLTQQVLIPLIIFNQIAVLFGVTHEIHNI